MWQAFRRGSLAFQPQVIRNRIIRGIHHDHGDAAIGIEKSRGLQLRPAGRSSNTPGAGMNEFGKMPDIIVGIGINQLPGSCVGMNGRETEITHVIGAAFFIQQNIPVGPSLRTAIEIVDHRITIFFTQRPVVHTVQVKCFLTAFGKDQVLTAKIFIGIKQRFIIE